MQYEITEPGPLLQPDGSLRGTGFARSPLWDYERKHIIGQKNRIKEWDRYVIIDPDFVLEFLIADYAYFGVDWILFHDLSSSMSCTRNRVQVFESGDKLLSPTSVIGDTMSRGKRHSLEFRNGGTQRHIVFSMDRFSGSQRIEGNIVLNFPPQETLATARSLSASDQTFAYQHKIQGMAASGSFRIGNREFMLQPGRSFGALGWARGMWNRSNEWMWAGAAQWIDGVPLSINLGRGIGDRDGLSENAIFYKGQLHKLTDITWDIPMSNQKVEPDKPWRLTSDDGRLYLVFTPFTHRRHRLFLGFVDLLQHQYIGHFSGSIMLDDGTNMDIGPLLGFVEQVNNRW